MFLGERKQGNWFQFHLPTVKSVKALLCMYDFAFQNCNTVSCNAKKIVFQNCNTVSCKDCNAKKSFLETVIL